MSSDGSASSILTLLELFALVLATFELVTEEEDGKWCFLFDMINSRIQMFAMKKLGDEKKNAGGFWGTSKLPKKKGILGKKRE